MMKLESVESLLKEKDLKNPQFPFLNPDNRIYRLLLLQPKGELEYSYYFIREKSEKIKNQFKKFIEISIDKNIDITIAPEYSCPWELIEKIILEEISFPRENNLWVFGCQSITKNVLERINLNKNIEVFFDEKILNKPGNFLNPVCYLFKTKNNQNELKNVIILQFKTTPMGNLGDFLERDNMIEGEKIYYFYNNNDSIHLATFICSDVFDLDLEKVFKGLINNPWLFLHLQLNKNPRHQDFKEYRNQIFNNTINNKEVICLNWAKGTKISPVEITFSSSAFYIKTDEINKNDRRITDNHLKGLYYTYWSNRHSNNFYLNCDESIYLLNNTKTSQRLASPAISKRTGPCVNESFLWNPESDKWEINILSDGFKKMCEEFSCEEIYTLIENLQILEIERILTLSCGKIRIENQGKEKWFELNQLDFFKVLDDEVIKRITFTQDDDISAQDHRREIILNFLELIRILDDPNNFPESIKDLSKNSKIGYLGNNNLIFNLYSTVGNSNKYPATVVFIGNNTASEAKRIFDFIASWIEEDKEFFTRRLMVWYQFGGKIELECLSEEPKIGDIYISRNSILKD